MLLSQNTSKQTQSNWNAVIINTDKDDWKY